MALTGETGDADGRESYERDDRFRRESSKSDSKASVSASSQAAVRMERVGHDLRDIYSASSATEAM